MQSPKNLSISFALILLLIILASACDREATTISDRSLTTATPSEATLAILKKADAADAEIDHTVSKCATCMLAMAGQPRYTFVYGEYTLHFCSQQCMEHFAGQPEEVLLKLKFAEE
jgi:YHS domain-containing protein